MKQTQAYELTDGTLIADRNDAAIKQLELDLEINLSNESIKEIVDNISIVSKAISAFNSRYTYIVEDKL